MSEGRIDKLERLAKLRESGGLTIEEFEAEKAKVLNTSVNGEMRPKRKWGRKIALSFGLAVAVPATAKLLIDARFTRERRAMQDLRRVAATSEARNVRRGRVRGMDAAGCPHIRTVPMTNRSAIVIRKSATSSATQKRASPTGANFGL
jgi:hypothetical protein